MILGVSLLFCTPGILQVSSVSSQILAGHSALLPNSCRSQLSCVSGILQESWPGRGLAVLAACYYFHKQHRRLLKDMFIKYTGQYSYTPSLCQIRSWTWMDPGVCCSVDYSSLCDLTHGGSPPPGLFNPSAKLRKNKYLHEKTGTRLGSTVLGK